MFYVLSKLLDVLLSPLSWGILLIALAIPWRPKRPRRPTRDRLLGAGGIAVIVVFSLAPVANALFAWLEASAKDTSRPGVTYDAVVLLGGLVDDDASLDHGATAYNDSVERLLVTFDVLRTNRARMVIVSAGPPQPHGEPTEADRLRDQLVLWGIAPERIVVEPRSANTHENAMYVAEIAKAQGLSSLLLVTSAFHMARAEGCFRGVGLAPDALPADYRARNPTRALGSLLPRSSSLDTSTLALHELFGRLVYRVVGYSKPPS